MSDEDQSALDSGTSDTPAAPVVGQADLDAWRTSIVADLTRVTDDRFSGFQKLLAKRDQKLGSLEQTLEELKSRTLSEDEREQLTDKALQERLRAAEAENEILKLSREYPAEVVSDFESLLGAESAKDQLEILKRLRTPAEQPAIVTAPSPEGIGAPSVQPASSEVDPNNPPTEFQDGLDWEQAFTQDPSLLDKILRRG